MKDVESKWDDTVKGEPDNVRRVLGTVYSQTGFMRPQCSFGASVRNYANDHMDYNSGMEEYDIQFLKAQEALTSADFLASSAIFSEQRRRGQGLRQTCHGDRCGRLLRPLGH